MLQLAYPRGTPMRFLWVLFAALLVASCVAQEAPKPEPTAAPKPEKPPELAKSATRSHNTTAIWGPGLSLIGPRQFSWSRWTIAYGDEASPIPVPGVPPLPGLPPAPAPAANLEFSQLWSEIVNDPATRLSRDDLRTLSRDQTWPDLLDRGWGTEFPAKRCVAIAARLMPGASSFTAEMLSLVQRAVEHELEGTAALVDALAQSHLSSADGLLPSVQVLATQANFPGPESWGRVLLSLPVAYDPPPAVIHRIRAALFSASAPDWLLERGLIRTLESRAPALVELAIELAARPMSKRLLGTWRELIWQASGSAALAPLLQALCAQQDSILRAAALRCASHDDTCSNAVLDHALQGVGSGSLRDHDAAALVLRRVGLPVPAYAAPPLSARARAALLDLATLDPTGLVRVESKSLVGSLEFGWREPGGSVCTDRLNRVPDEGWRESTQSFSEHVLGLAEENLVAGPWPQWPDEPPVSVKGGDVLEPVLRLLPILLRYELGAGVPETSATRKLWARLIADAETEQALLQATAIEAANVFVHRAIEAFRRRQDAIALARLMDAKRCLGYARPTAALREPIGRFEAQVRKRLETALARERSPAGAVARLAELSLDESWFAPEPLDEITQQLTDEVLTYGLDAMWELFDHLDSEDVWLRGFESSPWQPTVTSPLTLAYAARRLFVFLCASHFGVVLDHQYLQTEHRPLLRRWLTQALSALNSQG